MLFNDITVTNEQDYFTLKDAMEASMLEAVDAAYYRLTGKVKISQEKFVENFTRRFTETSTFGQGNYGITFYQISEYPPKASVVIYDKTSGYNIYTYTNDVETTQTNIVNALSGILEGKDNTITYVAQKRIDKPSLTLPIAPYAVRAANPYADTYGRYQGGKKTNTYYAESNAGTIKYSRNEEGKIEFEHITATEGSKGYYEVTLPDGTVQYYYTKEEAQKFINDNGGKGTMEYIDMINNVEAKASGYYGLGRSYIRSVFGLG